MACGERVLLVSDQPGEGDHMKTLKDIDPALYAKWMAATRHGGWTKYFSRETERERVE